MIIIISQHSSVVGDSCRHPRAGPKLPEPVPRTEPAYGPVNIAVAELAGSTALGAPRRGAAATSRQLHVHARRLAPPSPSLSTHGEQNLDLALFSGPRLWPCFPGQGELSLDAVPLALFSGPPWPGFPGRDSVF